MTIKAALLCGHGSRDGEALAEVARMAALIAERLPAWRVDHGFLQYARPTIAERLAALADAGAHDIVALPGMLFAAGHVKADIPEVLAAFGKQRPDVQVRLGRALTHDDGVLDAAQARIEEAGGGVHGPAACLIVVGRGTADAEANATVCAAAQALKDRLGFDHAEAAFAGVAEPHAEAVLERVAARGFARVIVLPYFLFTGVLVKQLLGHVSEAAERHPNAIFTMAPHLGDHPRIVDAFVAGAHAMESGDDATARRAS